MFRRTAVRRSRGKAAKGSRARVQLPRIELPETGLPFTELVRNASSRLSKRRARSLKRESRPARQGRPIRAAQGQRRAIRGNRLRQRQT